MLQFLDGENLFAYVNAGPQRQRGDGLIKQHAQAVLGDAASGSRFGEEPRRERVLNRVEHRHAGVEKLFVKRRFGRLR